MTSRTVIYARVSTDEQAKDDRYGLPSQLKACRKYVAERGYSCQQELLEDFSGAELYRPELDKLREMAKEGVIDIVVVYDIDRLSRNAVHQFLIEDELKKLEVRIEYVTNEFSDTPEGRLQKLMLAGFAELEHAKIRERMMRGKKSRAEAGFPMPGRTAPYGYRYIKEKRKGWFEIDDEEARVVIMIYHWYIYGDEKGKKLGIGGITRKLTEMKIPTKNDKDGHQKKRDKGVWGHTSVWRILSGEVYKGDWYYQRREYSKGKYKPRERDEWTHISVPAIINSELWEAARKQAEVNNLHSPRNSKHPYLLRGRLTCGTCGYTFRCYTYEKRNGRSYYNCGGQKLGTSQDGQSRLCVRGFRRENIDEVVWEKIAELLKNPRLIFTAMEEKQKQVDTNTAHLNDRYTVVQREIESIARQIKKVIDLYLDDDAVITKEDVELKVAELKKRREQFVSLADELQAQIQSSEAFEANFEQVEEFCRMAQQGIDYFTFEDKLNTIVALNITAVLYRGATPEADILELRGFLPRINFEVGSEPETVKAVSPQS